MADITNIASSNGAGLDPAFDPTAVPLGNAAPLSANPTTAQRAQAIMAKHRQLLAKKTPWLYTYQLLGEFIMTRSKILRCI